jgi:hypothetical protein
MPPAASPHLNRSITPGEALSYPPENRQHALLFAALFAIGTELLRRQALGEFPDQPRRPLGASIRETAGRPARSLDGHRGQRLPEVERGEAAVRAPRLADLEHLLRRRHLLQSVLDLNRLADAEVSA